MATSPSGLPGATGIPELLSFECPRCGGSVEERFYGPCQPCRSALALLGGESGGEVITERFEPRMHVVPNQVATKD